jgi:hypothetical protein
MKLRPLNHGNPRNIHRQHAYLELDMLMAMMILLVAIVPLGFSFARERAVLRAEYFRSVTDELVDGEMEILAAGDWKNYPDGVQVYPVHANAAAHLPAGHFELTKNGNHLRLVWMPDRKEGIGAVAREITVK